MEGLSCGTLLFTHDVNDDVLDVKKKELPTAFHRRSLTYVLPTYYDTILLLSLFFHPNSQDFLRIQTTT